MLVFACRIWRVEPFVPRLLDRNSRHIEIQHSPCPCVSMQEIGVSSLTRNGVSSCGSNETSVFKCWVSLAFVTDTRMDVTRRQTDLQFLSQMSSYWLSRTFTDLERRFLSFWVSQASCESPSKKKNLSKSWTPLKGKSAETSNHHHDNNDGRNRDDVFSRDGDALRHYVNKLTLSGDISIRRHHSSSVP